MSSRHYINKAICCLEVELQKSGQRLVGKPSTPMTPGYRPELDLSPLLEPDQASYFMSLIGILHWANELGRINIRRRGSSRTEGSSAKLDCAS